MLDLFARWRLKGRKLFRYFDGGKWQYRDPFALWRALFTDPNAPDLEKALDAVRAGKEPETSNTLNWLAKQFGVARWNQEKGSGLTDGEILDLLDSFGQYLDEQKKSTESTPTLQEPTGSLSSVSLTEDAKTADCCSGSSSMPGE